MVMRKLPWWAWLWALGGCAAVEEDDSCDKVDILFVVDNSGTMADNQQNLADNFPKFAQNIAATLGEDVDYHVGVVTSDDYLGNEAACQQLGALVTQTAGPGAGGSACGPFKQGRFLSKEDALVQGFQCAARVGSGGASSEDVIGAATAALSPGMNAPGACNAGFLREDSLLVLVFITDEDAPGVMTEQWQQQIAQASEHARGNTVVVTLAKGVPGNVCAQNEAGSDGTALMAYTGQYKYNFLGDICAADYGDVLVKALAPVDSACKEYRINKEEEEEGSCRDEGPGVKDWLFSTLVLAGTTLVVSFAALQTLSRKMARSGYRQSSANLAGISLGLLMGGLLGSCVAVARDCGFTSAPGWLGIATALLGLILLAVGTLSGRPSE
jgi:hypothetical protein